MASQALMFKDRRAAGELLAAKLSAYANHAQAVILALPRGGVPVAYEVARALHLPLDVIIVRKLGAPGHSELAMGAIASGGVRVLNEDVIRVLNITPAEIEAVAQREHKELARRERVYRDNRPGIDVSDRTVILVDDGIATGATMRAAVAALRQRDTVQVIVAAPTAAKDSHTLLMHETDEVVCLSTPEPYIAVGRWYEDFTQTSDEEVRSLLRRSAEDLEVFTVERQRQ